MKKLISIVLAVMFAFSLLTVAAADEGAFTGIVTANNGATFTVANSYGTMLTFAKGAALAGTPTVGSTVTVDFSGSIATQLYAENVTVENMAVVKAASGTVRRINGQQVVIETAQSVLISLYVSDSTAIGGKANALAVGQTVNVTYSESVQFVTVVDIATAIEITGTAKDSNVEVNVDDKKEEKDTTNKKLTGTVTKLTDSKVTIKTSKGKTWSFRLNKYTSYSGKYDFEVGCTVNVTYDGYASNVPAAKKINITKGASHEPETHKTTGYCTFLEGMAIGLDNGFQGDILTAKQSGNGYRGEGTKCTVTYYVDNYGYNIVTKIKWQGEIVY